MSEIKAKIIKTERRKCSRGPRVLIECNVCQKQKWYSMYSISHNGGKYCSKKCADKAREHTHNTYRGGKTVNSEGYMFIFSPLHPFANSKGYVREHRLIAENKLGRYLDENEIIHHINLDPTDNRVDNLYVFKNRGEHKTYHLFLRSGKVGLNLVSNL